MLKIGITGGIGSGKSLVAKMFASLGVPVYYADAEAKKLMNSDPKIKNAILQNFGEESYIDGQLNRTHIASIVFNNPEKLSILNSITHGPTIDHANRWMEKQDAPYVLKEAALIFESDSYRFLDKIIGVSAPLFLRISRTMARDGISEEAVLKRMERQMDEDDKMSRCDYIIINDEKTLLLPQVLSLHELFVNAG